MFNSENFPTYGIVIVWASVSSDFHSTSWFKLKITVFPRLKAALYLVCLEWLPPLYKRHSLSWHQQNIATALD